MTDRNKELDTPTNLTRQLQARNRRRRAQMTAASQVASIGPRRNDLLPALTLECVRLSDLRPSAAKLRRLEPNHVREVAASIARLGFCDPLLIGADGELIDGEARFAAAEQLGLERAPCIRVEHLSRDELRVLRLAVNRLAEKGQWDLDALKIEFEQLIVVDAPIEISGFAPAEIDHILLGDEAGGLETGPLKPPAGATPVSRPGDIFLLGPHRVICGDARDPEIVRRLMRDDPPAQLLLTDEPYNVPISGHVTGGSHREFGMASGEMSNPEFLAFNEAWMAAALPSICDGAVFGTFIDWRGYPTVYSAAIELARSAQSYRVDEDQRRDAQPLPLPARVAAPVPERLRLARQQYRARQAGALALERLDVSGRFVAWLRRPPRPSGPPYGQADRDARRRPSGP